MKARLLTGDCLERLRELPDASVAAVVTDPPYGLGFMGKAWDHAVPSSDVWREVLRVLRPGGHMVAFFGSRTYHRGAVAIEDAGFEIRDQIMWIYGSGFPKSLDVSKAIDKAAGVERQLLGVGSADCEFIRRGEPCRGHGDKNGRYGETVHAGLTAPATDAARQWSGWGTALKPAHEPIVLARKPLVGTVAANVLAHGTGALNVEGCRVGTESTRRENAAEMGYHGGNKAAEYTTGSDAGRWPANVAHDGSDEVMKHFPRSDSTPFRENVASGDVLPFSTRTAGGFSDSGSAARFFYSPKADAEDRNEGLPRGMRNTHPTVKPVDLMRWLVKLITSPGGLVLDPFMGSGSTGKAALLDGFDFIGVDLDPKHVAIAEARLRNAGGLFVEIEVG